MNGIIKSLTFYPNGAVLAFDEQGEQMDDVQAKGWMELYLERLEAMGYDPEEIPMIRAVLNDGTWKQIVPFRCADGLLSFRIEPNYTP